jgi:hypothetical protein
MAAAVGRMIEEDWLGSYCEISGTRRSSSK